MKIYHLATFADYLHKDNPSCAETFELLHEIINGGVKFLTGREIFYSGENICTMILKFCTLLKNEKPTTKLGPSQFMPASNLHSSVND
jgi:hypothetical protein